MNIFPSTNEKLITIAIVSFLSGAVVGLFASVKITDQRILLPAIATLTAAFLGAWAAYKLQDNKNKREYEETCLKNGNSMMFALYERIKALRLVQKRSINPYRNDPLRMISMMPLMSFSNPDSEFNVESLLFLLGTKHKQLILDLHNEKECFKIVFYLIKFRSELHFKDAQPAIEKSKMKEGEEFTKKQMIDALGERVFAQLERTTDDLIEYVDTTLESSEKIKLRLVAALNDLFPNKTVLNYEFEKQKNA